MHPGRVMLPLCILRKAPLEMHSTDVSANLKNKREMLERHLPGCKPAPAFVFYGKVPDLVGWRAKSLA